MAVRVNPDAEYQTYFATRSTPTAGFERPILVASLANESVNFVDAFLTDDCLTLLFQRGGDLYYSQRSTPDDDFLTVQPIDGINTDEYSERDPWLSDDGMRLYFTREGDDGTFDMWVVDAASTP
jgi:hypothetical protein